MVDLLEDVHLFGCLPVCLSSPTPHCFPQSPPPKLFALKYLSQSLPWGAAQARTSSCHQFGSACVSHTPLGRMPQRSKLSTPLWQVHTLKSGPFGHSMRKRMWHLCTSLLFSVRQNCPLLLAYYLVLHPSLASPTTNTRSSFQKLFQGQLMVNLKLFLLFSLCLSFYPFFPVCVCVCFLRRDLITASRTIQVGRLTPFLYSQAN